MSDIWNKLDSGLSSIYSDYLEVQKHGVPRGPRLHPAAVEGGRLQVTLQYAGELREIEALGFETILKEEVGLAQGTVDLADLKRFAAHQGVLELAFGTEPEPLLDKSIPDVKANQVWTFSSGTFSGKTGKGVIVGIIDTGIDFHHLHFRQPSSPRTTRILRIWDQGLKKKPWENQPAATDLEPGGTGTYGVVYTNDDIDKTLKKIGDPSKFVRHRDCKGHGTHVASIAAGNGESKNKFIGVAPEADLVVVKYLDLEEYPATVSHTQRFKDAVRYILKVAEAPDIDMPVAINCSFGNHVGPHDGFTVEEDWLTHTFASGNGRVLVQAAGNDGGHNQHAKIDLAGAGTAELHFDFYERRGAKKLDFRGCQPGQWGTIPLDIEVWYPEGGPTVTVELDLPGGGANFITGPALGGAAVEGTFGSGRKFRMTHAAKNPTLLGGRGTVKRNLFKIKITPKRNRHILGRYTVRVHSTGPLTAHVWCRQRGYKRGHGFEVASSSPTPAENSSLIGQNGGADNIITVAAYHSEVTPDDTGVSVPDVTKFSSRGPLVSYGGGPPQPPKPDLAAPGAHIDAAKGVHAKPWKAQRTTPKNGTSMAAPHVAGAAALLLQENTNLTSKQIADTLRDHIRTTAPPDADEVGKGRLDCKDAFDNVP